MAMILRSSRYISCLNVFSRRIIVSNENNTFVRNTCLELRAQCANSYLTKSYATVPATKHIENVPNFDITFAKLDSNVQRHGRVFKLEVEAVLSQVRETGSISSLDALLLIRCCGNLLADTMPSERNKFVDEIWSTLDVLKIPVDVSHFNALLRIYLENNREFSPIEFLTTMHQKGAEPNRITYQRLMLHHCKKGDIEGATKILELMREKDIALNEGVFNALILGHSEAGDIESAKNIMKVMKEAGITPGSSTYTALLVAYAKRGDMDTIRDTLDEFSTKNLYLQDNDYFQIIHSLALNDHTNKVDEILSIMPMGPNYNIDAAQAILKVLDCGNVDVALKILSTMRKRKNTDKFEPTENENGMFLIRKLVNSKYPADKIISACEYLQSSGENIRAFNTAVHRSLCNGDIELSLSLLEGWRKNDGEIREHYFWPLMIVHGRDSNYQGILDLVRLMMEKFNVKPTFETIKEYVLPYTVGKWDEIVNSLRELRIPHSTITSAIANRMLHDFKIRKTATFMLNYPSRYEAEHFLRTLSDSTRKTGDAKSCAIILRILCEPSTDDMDLSTMENIPTPLSIVDTAMRIMLDRYSNDNYQLIEKILENLVQYGLSISPEVGSEIRDYLADNMSPMIEESIEKLTSGNLTPIKLSDLKASITGDQETDDVLRNDKRGQERSMFVEKRRELSAAIEKQDIASVENITQDLESMDFNFSLAICAQLMDVYCVVGDLEKAEKWLKKFKAESPKVPIDLQKTTSYAALLIKNDRFDDAVNFILNSPRSGNPENIGPGLRALVKRLLEVAAETGNVEKTKELFDALLRSNFFVVDNFLLGPLVKVHLARGDLAGAMDTFEHACQTHRCTPLKNELSKKFINSEDAVSLQRLTDLSTEVHGESNSLIDLVLAFVECGRLRQARKILETPGLRIGGRKLKNTLERYMNEELTDYLEQFTDITKGLPVMDRQEFYDILMEAYRKKNNWQRGLNLWTTIQEEDVQPSDIFLRTLAELLKMNRQPIPFIYNNNIEIPLEATAEARAENDIYNKFYKAVSKKDLKKAEDLLSDLSPQNEEFSTAVSELIISYIQDFKDVNRASQIAEEAILKHGRLPRAHALKAIWNRFVDDDDIEKLKKHGNILNTDLKEKLRFHKYLIRAEVKKVGVTKYLADFEAKLTDSKNENYRIVQKGLHFTTIVKEFKNDPTGVENFHKIAEKLAEQEIYSPINMIWCYYFEAQKPEADEIWSKHLAKSDRVMFKYILAECRTSNNVELAERLYQKILTNEGLTEGGRVYVLSNVVDLYTTNGRTNDALKIVKNTPHSTLKLWNKLHPIMVKNFMKSLEDSGESFSFNFEETRLGNQ